MKYFNCIILLLFRTILFGQTESKSIFYTYSQTNDFYYSKTAFSLIDTLSRWNYSLDTSYKGDKSQHFKSLGQLIFWRIKSNDDDLNKKSHIHSWAPKIKFDIFDISDSTFCFEKSSRARAFSSCVPPDVGGDMIIFDKFIFLNTSVCIDCQRDSTKFDYCRPVINYIFTKVDRTQVTTLESLVEQFVISKREVLK